MPLEGLICYNHVSCNNHTHEKTSEKQYYTESMDEQYYQLSHQLNLSPACIYNAKLLETPLEPNLPLFKNSKNIPKLFCPKFPDQNHGWTEITKLPARHRRTSNIHGKSNFPPKNA